VSSVLRVVFAAMTLPDAFIISIAVILLIFMPLVEFMVTLI